ncbi:MAG: hypothetical protein HQL95_11360 [Magnetococcales bacterium]|nr:hypothetical protein [Magnetococcales bacterium]
MGDGENTGNNDNPTLTCVRRALVILLESSQACCCAFLNRIGSGGCDRWLGIGCCDATHENNEKTAMVDQMAMNTRDEHRIAAKIAEMMAMLCVRNTQLEALHAGRVPVSRTGDFSDLRVIDADGNEIPWPEVSHLDDDEMKAGVSKTAPFRMNFLPDFWHHKKLINLL